MRRSVISLCSLAVMCLSAASAHALPAWKPKFQQMYVDNGPESLKTAFADKVIGSCKVCHVNGEEKTVRNPFGIALDKHIKGNAGKRLAEAAKQGDDAKAALQAELDKELLKALDTVLKTPSPSGGGTYGERLKAGQLPFVPAAVNQLTDEEQQQGFVLLFNGKDLDGWKPQSAKHFRVENGSIVCDGTLGRSMLYYVGDGQSGGFDNFELRLQVLVHKGANSGIYFRTKWQDEGYPDAFGYEAQIANTHKNPAKTGSIFRIQSLPKSPVKDGEWFDYHILANGRTIRISLNGKLVTEFTEPTDPQQRKPAGSLISLQCHDPAVVEFRSIRIRSVKPTE